MQMDVQFRHVISNTVSISNKHSLVMTDEHSRGAAGGGQESEVESGAVVVQKAMQ